MIRPDEEKMIVTPAHYVYQMSVPHHDATLLPEELKCEDYALNGQHISGLNASSSARSEGAIHVMPCHLTPTSAVPVSSQSIFRRQNQSRLRH
jgi:alpha-N-arabinofuranosidase